MDLISNNVDNRALSKMFILLEETMRSGKKALSLTLFASIAISGCQTPEPVQIPVVPVSTSHVLPAGTIASDAVSRVGVTNLPVPGPVEFAPIAQGNFLQAFLDMGLEAKLTTNGFIVHLPSDSHFDLNKATLKPFSLGSDQSKLSSIGLGDSTPKFIGERNRRTDFLFTNR